MLINSALPVYSREKVSRVPSSQSNDTTSATAPEDKVVSKYPEDFGRHDGLIYGGGTLVGLTGATLLAKSMLGGSSTLATLLGGGLGFVAGALPGSADDLFLHDTRNDFATVRRGAVGASIGAAGGLAGMLLGSALGNGTAGAVVGSLAGGAISFFVNDAWLDRREAEYEKVRYNR